MDDRTDGLANYGVGLNATLISTWLGMALKRVSQVKPLKLLSITQLKSKDSH